MKIQIENLNLIISIYSYKQDINDYDKEMIFNIAHNGLILNSFELELKTNLINVESKERKIEIVKYYLLESIGLYNSIYKYYTYVLDLKNKKVNRYDDNVDSILLYCYLESEKVFSSINLQCNLYNIDFKKLCIELGYQFKLLHSSTSVSSQYIKSFINFPKETLKRYLESETLDVYLNEIYESAITCKLTALEEKNIIKNIDFPITLVNTIDLKHVLALIALLRIPKALYESNDIETNAKKTYFNLLISKNINNPVNTLFHLYEHELNKYNNLLNEHKVISNPQNVKIKDDIVTFSTFTSTENQVIIKQLLEELAITVDGISVLSQRKKGAIRGVVDALFENNIISGISIDNACKIIGSKIKLEINSKLEKTYISELYHKSANKYLKK